MLMRNAATAISLSEDELDPNVQLHVDAETLVIAEVPAHRIVTIRLQLDASASK